VALSGDGGDELFGGYWRYLGHHYLARYRRLPAVVRRGLIEPLLRLVPDARSTRRLDRLRQLRKLLRGDLPDPLDRHVAWARFMSEDLAAGLLGRERAEHAQQEIRGIYREAASGGDGGGGGGGGESLGDDPFQQILRADLGVGLPDDMLFKVDTASMMHALEVRVPLLSADLVRFVTALPLGYKITGTTGKRILRDAVSDLLPAEIANRSKMGFEVPVGEFLRGELRDAYLSSVTPGTLSGFGINPAAAQRAYDDHLRRRRDHTELLWALFVLCRWKSDK
jgi:asparagine synthase (glutamine-hydrolysing)